MKSVMFIVAMAVQAIASAGLIDSFDTPQFVASTPALSFSNVAAPDALGGWRQLQAFGSFGNLTGTTGIFNSTLSYSNGPSGAGILSVFYTSNNLGLGGGLGTNLFAGGATQFSIDVVEDDVHPTILNYRVEDVFGGVSTAFANIGASAAGTSFVVPFSAFSGTALFGSAKTLQMTIAGAANADIVLDSFQTTSPVPEPSSALLALSGLALASVYFRRRQL